MLKLVNALMFSLFNHYRIESFKHSFIQATATKMDSLLLCVKTYSA